MKFTYPSGATPLEGYTIKRGIGIGGFGEVYFALNDAGKEVALKKIQRNLDIELRGVRQCLNMKHVNLISLWDIRTTGEGESWVVMEYVPGPSLRDVLEANQNGLKDDDVKSWFASTASGVSYLHENGIVHRDLKPGNIFCDLHEQVIKIGDYGLSKYISCSRRSGQTESVGTFHYMAPEIGKGVYGKEIDLYALGIILFELTTGLVPFDGESAQEIIMKHLTAEPDVSAVPIRFRKVVAKALRKDPEDRYRSISEMAADLPWPDVAWRSDSIVSPHSIGSLVQPDSAKPNRQSTKPNRTKTTELVDKLPKA
ncbi:MAG: serine/threonine protein kinase, partial [Planctomycetaceae bacterium]|nr:serine/threonine protein kinase [Planctomycetaceae bacterium]